MTAPYRENEKAMLLKELKFMLNLILIGIVIGRSYSALQQRRSQRARSLRLDTER